MTKMRRVAYCMVMAAWLGACTTSGDGLPEEQPPTIDDPGDDPEPEPGDSVNLVFSSSYEAAAAGDNQTAFDLLDTEQIVATFSAPVADGVQVFRFDLYLPSGAIYQRYWGAYTSDPALVGTEVPHPEVDRALRVYAYDLADAGEGPGLYALIRVSGTTIAKNVVTGIFRQEIFVEGQTEPAGAGEFEVVMP